MNTPTCQIRPASLHAHSFTQLPCQYVRSTNHDTSTSLDQFTGAVSAVYALTNFAVKIACTVSCSRSRRPDCLPTPSGSTLSAPACAPSRINSFSACQDIERAVRPRPSQGHSSDTFKSGQRRADLMGHSAGPTWCAAMPEPCLSSCTIGRTELQLLYCGSLFLMSHLIS